MALTPHASYEDYKKDHLARGNSAANMVSASQWSGGNSSQGGGGSGGAAPGATKGRADKPAWWNEEKDGRWDSARSQTLFAFESILGRTISPGEAGGFNSWAQLRSQGSYADVVRLLSLSDEARSRGVDPTQYGNEEITAENVRSDLKPYYDEWRKIHGDEPFYSGHQQLLRAQKDMGSVAVYQGLNDGTIQQLGPKVYQVTQAAVDKYGADNLSFTGYNAGAIIMVPKDSGIKVGRKKHGQTTASRFTAKAEDGKDPWTAQYENEGYEVWQATGAVHVGFMDRIQHEMVEHLGMSEDVAAGAMLMGTGGSTLNDFLYDVGGIEEGYFLSDPGNMYTGWWYGDEGSRHNTAGAMDIFGKDKKKPDDWKSASRTQGYVGSAAATIVAAVPVVGWAISAGLSAARSFSQAQLGQMDWGTAVGNAAISTVAGRVGAGYSAAANAAIQAGSSAAQAYLTNQDSHTVEQQNLWAAAATGAAGGLAGAFANAIGAQAGLGQWTQGFLNAATASAASYGGAYLSAWGNGGEVDSDSAAFNAILAGASAFGKAGETWKRNQSERDLMRRYDDAFDKMNIPMPGSGDRAGLTPAEAAALGPRPPETFAERLSYEFGGLDENNEFSWFSNRRPQAEPAPLSAVQRAEQYLLDKATPWATGHEQYVRDGGWLTDAVDKYTTDLGASQLVESGWAAPAAYSAPSWAPLRGSSEGFGSSIYADTMIEFDRLFAEPYDFSGLRLAPGR